MVFSPFGIEDVAGVQEKFIQTLVKYGKEDFFSKRERRLSSNLNRMKTNGGL